MTVTEAIGRVRALLKRNEDHSSTMHGILDARTVEALAKLVTVATDNTFNRPRGRR